MKKIDKALADCKSQITINHQTLKEAQAVIEKIKRAEEKPPLLFCAIIYMSPCKRKPTNPHRL